MAPVRCSLLKRTVSSPILGCDAAHRDAAFARPVLPDLGDPSSALDDELGCIRDFAQEAVDGPLQASRCPEVLRAVPEELPVFPIEGKTGLQPRSTASRDFTSAILCLSSLRFSSLISCISCRQTTSISRQILTRSRGGPARAGGEKIPKGKGASSDRDNEAFRPGY